MPKAAPVDHSAALDIGSGRRRHVATGIAHADGPALDVNGVRLRLPDAEALGEALIMMARSHPDRPA